MNTILNVFRLAATQLVNDYVSGKIDLLGFHIALRALIRKTYLTMAIAGYAPKSPGAIPSWVYLRTANPLKAQYNYLAKFMRDVRDGKVSSGRLLSRVLMYINSSRQMWWRGKTQFILPAYPGDGSTACKANCACSWDLKELYGPTGEVIAVEATWRLGPTEHCPDCARRAIIWNPIIVRVTHA